MSNVVPMHPHVHAQEIATRLSKRKHPSCFSESQYLTVADLQFTLDDPEHRGHGWASRNTSGKSDQALAERVIESANLWLLTLGELFIWSNSIYARFYRETGKDFYLPTAPNVQAIQGG